MATAKGILINRMVYENLLLCLEDEALGEVFCHMCECVFDGKPIGSDGLPEGHCMDDKMQKVFKKVMKQIKVV